MREPETMDRLPLLDRELLLSPAFQQRADIAVPDAALLDLPERAVQFGTGAFLRGFIDCFIDDANRRGLFGGRIVAVGSTGSGRDELLNEQDGLYTLTVRGMIGGERRQEHRVVASVSRAISAATDWAAVLACAHNPDLELVFSNTTEVGIALDEGDRAGFDPPRSFPGKLTRFLYERGRVFEFDPGRGVVVLPCELIEDNGDRLRAMVLALGERWGLEPAFDRWIRESVPFCNTLVDRIVPGAPHGEQLARLRTELGYRDEMLTICEPYRLFAIEADAALRERLPFADADDAIVVAPDIRGYRERKVHLLNGAHTVMAPVALLCGFETVSEAIANDGIAAFVRRAMIEEIVPGLDVPDARSYAREVLDRFANPFIQHALIDITLQGTTKMRVRVAPAILRYFESTGRPPLALTFGFAAWLLFARSDVQEARRADGRHTPADDAGQRIRALWCASNVNDASAMARMVQAICADRTLWGADLTRIPGFVEAVTDHLVRARHDAASVFAQHLAARAAAAT